MLKNVKIFAVLLTGIILSGSALAQTKVAVFNLQAAIMSTEIAKSKVNALKTSSEYSELQSNAESVRVELQKLAEEAQKDGVTWSEEKKTEQQRKMNFKRSDFETAVKKLQALEAQVGQELQREMLPKARTALQAIIEEQKLDLVLDASVSIHAAPGSDVTAEVVKRMNADK